MCEMFPGPRCSYDLGKKIEALHVKLLKAQKEYGAESPQYWLATERYAKALDDYDATPKGIQEIKHNSTHHPDNTELAHRLKVVETIRLLQTNAIKEVKNGRVDALATLTSSIKDFYDTAEAKSIIGSSRAAIENYRIKSLKKDADAEVNVEVVEKETYGTYIESLKKALEHKHGLPLPEKVQESLTKLEELPAPDSLNMEAYRKLPQAFDKSKTQLIQEIKNAAALQGVSPKITAEFYEAYRKQYSTQLQSLPLAERPDPPEAWVRGEFDNSGYAKDPASNFAPHDPASMYAIYRLRADDNAIPDYMKSSRTIASIDLETAGPPGREGFLPENGKIIEVGVKMYSPNGKTVGEISQLVKPETSFLKTHGTGAQHIHGIKVEDLEGKPSWKQIQPQLTAALKGKVLLAQNANFESSWLNHHLEEFNSNDIPIIDTLEMSRKYLDLPNNKLQTICEANGVAYTNGHRALHDAEATGEVYFKIRKRISKTWDTKTARRNAPPLTILPSGSRWTKPTIKP